MSQSRILARLSCVLALSACATPQPAAESGAAQPATIDVASEAPWVIGRVLGHDGAPLSAGHLVLARNGYFQPEAELSLPPDGRFRVQLPGPGVYRLRLAGVDHAEVRSMFAVQTGSVQINGQLGTYTRAPVGERVHVRLRYVDEAGQAGAALELEAQAVNDRAQIYQLTLEPPTGSRSVQYQLVEPRGRSYNGPGGAGWVYDGGGDFWAQRQLPANSTLELDLSLLAPAGLEGSVEIDGGTVTLWRGREAEVALDSDGMHARLTELFGSATTMDQACAGVRLIANDARALALALSDTQLREVAALTWAQMFGQFAKHGCLVAADLAWVLEAVPAKRQAWAFLGAGIDSVFGAMFDDPEIQEFRRQLEAAHDEPGLRAHLLSFELFEADMRGDTAALRKHYAALTRDYAGSVSAKIAWEHFDPERPLQAGRTMPKWAFTDLDGAPVSSDSLRGRPYLIDVWATWCGPCVDEMDTLHAAYEALGGEHSPVDFVSVSLDVVIDDLAAFRRDRWPMPWANVHVPPTQREALFDAWQFRGVPLIVLVDGAGRIVATEEALRGDKLLPTLRAQIPH